MTHYETLNVKKTASEQEIKKAYKKLALSHHPDRGGDPNKFKEVQTAYETLINDREEYDESLEHNPFSLFNMFRKPQKQRFQGKDITFEFTITLEEAFFGITNKLRITRKVICPNCEGQGCTLEEYKAKCTDCNGSGTAHILKRMGMMQIVQTAPCQSCSQRGYTIRPEHRCNACQGNTVVQRPKEITVPIRPGSKDGEYIVIQGMADEGPNLIPGNLLIKINIKSHSVFTRKNNDLHMTKELSLYEALNGYDFTIRQLDGSKLRIQHSGATQPNTDSSVKDKGMTIADTSNRGTLWIHFKVKLPEALPNNIISLLKDYQ